jgi:hypothetical protein
MCKKKAGVEGTKKLTQMIVGDIRKALEVEGGVTTWQVSEEETEGRRNSKDAEVGIQQADVMVRTYQLNYF